MKIFLKSRQRIGGYFTLESKTRMRFHSANALKPSLLYLFLIVAVIDILANLNVYFTSDTFVETFLGRGEESLEYWIISLSPLIFLIAWLLAPSTSVHFDRASGQVHYRHGRIAFTLPWSQVTFNHQWFPTKVGGSTLFSLVVTPPYPPVLEKKVIEKVGPAFAEMGFVFRLGSFDVSGPEHGQAIFAFLDQWMRTQDPAEAVYVRLVGSRFT